MKQRSIADKHATKNGQDSPWRLFFRCTPAILLYYVVFQVFYNMIAYRHPLPYSGLADIMDNIARNLTGILACYILNFLIVFLLRERERERERERDEDQTPVFPSISRKMPCCRMPDAA